MVPRLVDVTDLTRTTYKRRQLSEGKYEKAGRKLILENCQFLCMYGKTHLRVSKLYHRTDEVGTLQNTHTGMLYVDLAGIDLGVEHLIQLWYIEPFRFQNFCSDDYTRVWVEDDATGRTEDHETWQAAFDRLFGLDPVPEQRDEHLGDQTVTYMRSGHVLRVYPEGSELWTPK